MNRDEWLRWYLDNICVRASSFGDPAQMANDAFTFANTMLKLNQFTLTERK